MSASIGPMQGDRIGNWGAATWCRHGAVKRDEGKRGHGSEGGTGGGDRYPWEEQGLPGKKKPVHFHHILAYQSREVSDCLMFVLWLIEGRDLTLDMSVSNVWHEGVETEGRGGWEYVRGSV